MIASLPVVKAEEVNQPLITPNITTKYLFYSMNPPGRYYKTFFFFLNSGLLQVFFTKLVEKSHANYAVVFLHSKKINK